MKNICFHVIKYYPSLGGTELLAKQIIDHISEDKKYNITVLTTPEPSRDHSNFPYTINENMIVEPDKKYDLSVFFSDLWSPQLNNYDLSSANTNICILNLDDTTYQSRKNFKKAIENLKSFDMIYTFSKNGIINKFLEEENIKNTYISNFSRDTLKEKPVFNLKQKFKLDNRPVGLYCAAYYRIKNQIYLLEKINSSEKLKNYNWIFIGNEADKIYYRECVNFVKNNKINNVYFAASTKDYTKLDSLYQQVDFVALLSQGEGMPLTILEAAAANKPIIHTPVGGTSGVLAEASGDGLYTLEEKNYSADELDLNIKLALIYKSQNLRNIWLRNHRKEDILEKYNTVIKNYLP